MPQHPPVLVVVDRIKRSNESNLEMLSRAIPFAIDNGKAKLAHSNVRKAASSCIRLAMVFARYDKDFDVARSYLSRCADYADTLDLLAKQGLEGTPWSAFYVLYAGLAAGRFDRVTRAAEWMLQCPVVAEDDADPHDPLALLSALGALDMQEKFSNVRSERYDRSWHASHPFFGPLSAYLDLWSAILGRDQGAFDAAMVRREEHCVRLSMQKGEGRLEFGGGEDSKYVIDFMGIGCVAAARKHGMKCDVDTTYLPRALVDLAAG